MYQQKVTLEQISGEPHWQGRAPDGRWVGMLRVTAEGRPQLLAALAEMRRAEGFDQKGLPDLINYLVAQGHAPQVQYIAGHWMDINDLDDLQRAGDFAHGQRS